MQWSGVRMCRETDAVPAAMLRRRFQTLLPPLSCANALTVRGRRGRQSLQSRTEAESSDRQLDVTVVETVSMTELSGPAPSAATAEPKRCSLIGCRTLFVVFLGSGSVQDGGCVVLTAFMDRRK